MAASAQRLVTELALNTAVAGKANTSHTHAGLEVAAGYKARLDSNGVYELLQPDGTIALRWDLAKGAMTKGGTPWSLITGLPGELTDSLKDTGWRNASSILTNGWAGKVLARRVGKTVTFVFDGVDSTAATSSTISSALELMLSPEATTGLNIRFSLATAAQTVVRGYIPAASRDIRVSAYPAGSLLYGTVSFPTSRAFDNLAPYVAA